MARGPGPRKRSRLQWFAEARSCGYTAGQQRRLSSGDAAAPPTDLTLFPCLRHPQHELARRQIREYGGTFSFRLRGGEEAVLKVLGRVRVFTLAESLGGVESLIEHPATMTHASMPKDVRDAMGITPDLIRVSVGLEDVTDLIADLSQALEAA